MIRVEHISKSFGNTQVLEDINFHIKEGEVIGFLGPNGAGKTTTLRILTGYINASHGDVTIGSLDIAEKSLEIRKHIGYLPESNPSYDAMRVYEYLEFAARIKGLGSAQDEIRRVVAATQLEAKISEPISELSKGFRQRVGLADALLGDPDVLILDEPTSGLDPNQAEEIRKLIREIGKTKTVIFSTHILQEVQTTCDRVLIINEGRIVAEGTVDDLINQSQGKAEIQVRIEGPQHEITKVLKNLPHTEEVKEYKDEEFVILSSAEHDVCRDIYKACVDNNWVLLRMQTSDVSLEDVFRQLTK